LSRHELPAIGTDHFTVFGLPKRHELDADELERRYLELASAVHPDRFSGAEASERRRAMEASAAVNEGYRVLRDPVRRAEYLCRIGGIDLDSSDPEHGAPHMGQGFLVEMIERRETVEARRAEGLAALGEYRDRIEDEMDATFARAVGLLGEGRVGDAAHALVERRYLQRLIDEIDEIDEAV
jgi:molecular chaperone HscB